MSYQLYDIEGFIADVATTKGFGDLRRWVERLNRNKAVSNRHLQIAGLLSQGAALITQELLDEMRGLPTPNDAEVNATLRNLTVELERCDTVAIISNGVKPEE